MTDIKTDDWVWGRELIVWGFDSSHKYTFKILEPKRGRAGCMSLQYHDDKSETWLVLRGAIWALLVVDGKVCTRIMRAGDVQNIVPGVIHRLAGVSEDARIAEPSTPDAHAADRSQPKDIVRLHCVHGRPSVPGRTPEEEALVREAVEITDEALAAIDRGELPREYNTEFLAGRGALRLPA